MANNNFRYRQSGSYVPRSYNNNRSYGNYGGNSGGNAPAKKHSGCQAGIDKNGNPYVRGWKYTKRQGLLSFFAAPTKNSKIVTSKTGKRWASWVCKIVSKDTLSEHITVGLWEESTNRVILDKIGIIMSPKGGVGGYVGPYGKKR